MLNMVRRPVGTAHKEHGEAGFLDAACICDTIMHTVLLEQSEGAGSTPGLPFTTGYSSSAPPSSSHHGSSGSVR